MLPSHFTFNGEDWSTVQLCGEGTFSQCFQIRNKSGKNLAVKVCKPGWKYEFTFDHEIQTLSLVKSRLKPGLKSFIVNYIDLFTISGSKCIVMEFLGCNLNELLTRHEMKGLTLYLIKKILNDLLFAAMFLDELGIAHGDIKPSNILWNMNSECFQLIDFSISFKSDIGSGFNQPLQSPGYQAPEVLQWNKKIKAHNCNGAPGHSAWLDTSIDLWSIGCVLVYVCTGEQLYLVEQAKQLPLICHNCEKKCNPCIHSIRATHLINFNRKELQNWNIKDLAYVVSGFLQCRSDNRIRPSYMIENPFFGQEFKPTITDLLLLPTRVLRSLDMFDERDSEDIDDIMLDIQEECEKFGEIISVKSSKKNTGSSHVYVEYKYAEDCSKAQSSITGRYFDDRCVVATFFPWQQFYENDFY